MNTPNAYAVIFETVKKLNQTLRQREIGFAQLALYSNAVEKMLNVLGIVVDKPVIGEAEKELFAKWNQAKADKDFDSADKYRNELVEKGLL
jgi:cysteine--tRNA ligase